LEIGKSQEERGCANTCCYQVKKTSGKYLEWGRPIKYSRIKVQLLVLSKFYPVISSSVKYNLVRWSLLIFSYYCKLKYHAGSGSHNVNTCGQEKSYSSVQYEGTCGTGKDLVYNTLIPVERKTAIVICRYT
jgi:hypothetical protein